jgi:hypothetical protein
MADKFRHFQFRNTVNPTGILFHPLAIEKLICDALADRQFQRADIFEAAGRWHTFDAHSDMSGADPDDVLARLNDQMQVTKTSLKNASHIILTAGTAWAYRHVASGNLVANCHKIPQSEFAKELLTIQQIDDSLMRTIAQIRGANADAQIVVTVSPVRHLKDGFAENQRSKAHLISAVHQTVERTSGVHYFPAYEIMMDELRDYRFYADDMLHPSPVAIDFIWEKFTQAWMSESALADMKEVDAIRKALAHRPFDADAKSHVIFKETVAQRVDLLREKYPFMVF